MSGETPSISPKLDTMGELLKTIHDLNERNKVLEKQLTKAKELLNEFLDFESSCMERGIYISDKTRAETKHFIKEEK